MKDKFKNSKILLDRAMRIIPGASQTFSKQYTQYVVGGSPLFLKRGLGSHVWDVDDNEYIDYVLGLLPVILGHAHSSTVGAIFEQIEKGTAFSLPTELEIEVAQMLIDRIPCAEMVRFGKNGSDVTSGAIRAARAYTGRDMVACCYDEETEILTKDGFKKIKDIADDEVVATLNPHTNFMEYNKIDRKIQYWYEGNMVRFESKKVDLLVTPDHKIYRRFSIKAENNYYKLVEAQSEVGKKTITKMTAYCNWNGESPEYFVIPECKQKRKTKGVIKFKTKDFVEFLGWYLTEGNIVINKRGSYQVVISQSIGKNQEKCKQITALIERMGFVPRHDGDHHIWFNSKELCLYLKQFGKCKEKFIPAWIKSLSTDLLNIFINTMICGDGSFEGGKIRKFYSTSKRLVDDMQEILLRVGKASTISLYSGVGFSENSEVYHLSISHNIIRGAWAEEEYYAGNVYCVTVPNHIVLVRRNGKVLWSGNCGYHGWQDWYIGSTTRNLGVPKTTSELIKTFQYNKIETLEEIFEKNRDKIACVIMEPVGLEEPRDSFLSNVQALCVKNNSLLIFDEVITGFRIEGLSAQMKYNIIPDMATFGKAMGNGVPISAVVGRKEVMKIFNDIFFSFTFGGDTLGLVVAKATMNYIDKHSVVKHLYDLGNKHQSIYNELAAKIGINEYTQCKGCIPHRSVLTFKKQNGDDWLELKSLFIQEVASRQALTCGVVNLCFAHNVHDLLYTEKNVYEPVFLIICDAIKNNNIIELLKGPVVQPVFRKP